jgi:hypothetical protein
MLRYIQGRYKEHKGTLPAELACEGTGWAVRNLDHRQAACMVEYLEVFHGKTSAQCARHHGFPGLPQELEYYMSGPSIEPIKTLITMQRAQNQNESYLHHRVA